MTFNTELTFDSQIFYALNFLVSAKKDNLFSDFDTLQTRLRCVRRYFILGWGIWSLITRCWRLNRLEWELRYYIVLYSNISLINLINLYFNLDDVTTRNKALNLIMLVLYFSFEESDITCVSTQHSLYKKSLYVSNNHVHVKSNLLVFRTYTGIMPAVQFISMYLYTWIKYFLN